MGNVKNFKGLFLAILLVAYSPAKAHFPCSGGRTWNGSECVCPSGKHWEGMKGCVCTYAECEGYCCQAGEQCKDVGGGMKQCIAPCSSDRMCGSECCASYQQTCWKGKCSYDSQYKVTLNVDIDTGNEPLMCGMIDFGNKGYVSANCISFGPQPMVQRGNVLQFPEECVIPHPRRVQVTCHTSQQYGQAKQVKSGAKLNFPSSFN